MVRMQDALTLEAIMTVNAFLDIKVGCKPFQGFFKLRSWANELYQKTATGQTTQF